MPKKKLLFLCGAINVGEDNSDDDAIAIPIAILVS